LHFLSLLGTNGIIVYCPKYGIKIPIHLLDREGQLSVHGSENGSSDYIVEQGKRDLMVETEEDGDGEECCCIYDSTNKLFMKLIKLSSVNVLLFGEGPKMAMYRSPSVCGKLVTDGSSFSGARTSSNRSNVVTKTSAGSKKKIETREAMETKQVQEEEPNRTSITMKLLMDSLDDRSFQQIHSISSLSQITTSLTKTKVMKDTEMIKNSRRVFGFHRSIAKVGSLDDEEALHSSSSRSGAEGSGTKIMNEISKDINKLKRLEMEVQRRTQKLAVKKRESRRKR
jgi:hypothetical protein